MKSALARSATPRAATGIWAANEAVGDAERELARQAEVAYTRTVRDWHATQAGKEGASVTKGARIKYALRRAKLRGRPKGP